jgi:hypothetical protein
MKTCLLAGTAMLTMAAADARAAEPGDASVSELMVTADRPPALARVTPETAR